MKMATILATAAALAGTAQAATALTISGPYFEEVAVGDCNGDGACTVVFPVLPSTTTGFFINLTEVNCFTNVTAGLRSGRLYISDNGVNARRFHAFNVDKTPGETSFRDPMSHKVSGGPPRQLAIALYANETSATFFAYCTVVGTISSQ